MKKAIKRLAIWAGIAAMVAAIGIMGNFERESEEYQRAADAYEEHTGEMLTMEQWREWGRPTPEEMGR